MGKQINEPFKLWQKKLMQEPAPTFGNTVAKDEVIVDQTPKETVVDVTTQPKPQVDPNKFLGGIFDERPKAPVYNTTSDQQNQAMMKAQAMGNLLALVGDVGGVAAGANVARREMKPLEPYMAAIQRNREKYDAEKTAFDKEDWLYRLKEAESKSSAEAAAEKTKYERERDLVKDEKDAALLEQRTTEKGINDKRRTDAYVSNIESLKKQRSKTYNEKDDPPAFKITIDGKDVKISESEMRDIIIEDVGKYDEFPTGEEAEVKAHKVLREKSQNPHFKGWLLQKDEKGGIKNYQEYLKKSVSKGVNEWMDENSKSKFPGVNSKTKSPI